MIVVVMGVSGAGKTTVGQLVAAELGLPFHDADDFHSEASRRKMAAGEPLTERDREPWLQDLAGRIPAWESAGGAVLACSALRRAHRDLLSVAAPGRVVFAFLRARRDVVAARLAARRHHYMPPSLLDSQLEALEAPQGIDDSFAVDADRAPGEIADAVVSELRRRGLD